MSPPAVVGAVILGAELAASLGTAGTILVGAGALLAGGALISTGLNFAVQAIIPKPKRPEVSRLTGQTVMLRQSDTPTAVIYGETEVAGPIIRARR